MVRTALIYAEIRTARDDPAASGDLEGQLCHPSFLLELLLLGMRISYTVFRFFYHLTLM